MEMTKDEAFEYLKGKKTMVLDEDQSLRVQKKLFEVGFVWAYDEVGRVQHLDKPFLFADEDKELTYLEKTRYEYFCNHQNVFISPYEILGIEIKEEKEEPQFAYKQEVLVRDRDGQWAPAVFAYKDKEYDEFPYVVFGGERYSQGIALAGNEHLMGTSELP